MSNKRTWLVETIKADETRELFTDGIDVALGAIFESDFLSQVPFAGMAVKSYQAAKVIQERMLIKKLAKFLYYPSQMSEAEKRKFSAQFEDAEKEEEFGEQMLVLIDQSEDTIKPEIIGKLIHAHAKGHFDLAALMRLSKMVTRSFAEDLDYLKNMDGQHQRRDSDIEHSLNTVGFLRLKAYEYGQMGESEIAPSDIGYEKTVYGTWVTELGLIEGPPPDPEEPNTLFS